MLIRCPQCGTGFNLPAEKIPAKGAKVKCSACTHTFRVRVEHGEAVFFYKRGEQPTGQTMIGAPSEDGIFGDLDPPDGSEASDADASTQFGLPARSKSSKAGYDPFPLAKSAESGERAITHEANQTQLLGSAASEGGRGQREQDPPPGLHDPNERTLLGTPTSAGAAPRRRVVPPPTPVALSRDTPEPFGADGIDLFDDLLEDDEDEVFDPFGSAFDEPVGDVGLLLPSTPSSADDLEPFDAGLEARSDVGISEADFLRGGARPAFGSSPFGDSPFGDPSELVDMSADRPSFDPNEGVVHAKRAQPEQRAATSRRPEPRSERPADERQPPATSTAERIRRPAPAYVHELGATSSLRRTADAVFIAIVVMIAFVALVAARAGGFVDFARFGHMLEVAFTEQEFIPREAWTQVVEIPPPDPPPDEPLRIENLRAMQKQVGKETVLVVSGRVRNYSLEEFKAVKVKAVVTRGEKVLATRVELTGQQLDAAAFAKAKTVEAATKAVTSKLPDVGKEGTTYFVIVFDDIPAEAIAAGDFDYTVSVSDS